MKKIKTQDAIGTILCHDMTQIIKDVKKDAVFRKGHRITATDIPLLLSMGKEHIFVWEQEAGMLHENDAAEILYSICQNENLSPTPVKEGKIDLIATCDGLLIVDTERLRQINEIGEMMIATRHSYFPVKQGDKVAGTRVIPLTIHQDKMKKAQAIGAGCPILELRPIRPHSFSVITTGNEVAHGRITDSFTPVILEKMAEYGCEPIGAVISGDDPECIRAEIEKALRVGAEIVICTGGMSVDPDDRTPLAIRNSAERVVSYGAPVLPGAMFMLAYSADGRPIIGLPGCVMYSKRTIFDLILPRLLADVCITKEQIATLGHGGLCLLCSVCTFPNCGFGK